MDFFQTLQTILLTTTPHEKIERFQAFYRCYANDARHVSYIHTQAPLLFTEPSYTTHCHVVPPQQVPRRNNLQSREGHIALVHAIAHIEYSAIDLALDATYRFRNLPHRYYNDWLEVAADEIRHFQMLEKILHDLGSHYGALPVHNALFEAQNRTAHSLLHRIVDEEVAHVQKGDFWFRYACDQNGIDPNCYFEIIEIYYPSTFKKPRNINVKGRQESGFTCKELQQIAHKPVCDS